MLERRNPAAWRYEDAAHLLNRAAFGGSPEQIKALHARGLAGAVQSLLHGAEDDDLFPPPAMSQPPEVFEQIKLVKQTADEERRRELQRTHRQSQIEQIRALRTWWLNRMRHGQFPLREKMTLFWHSHFATSFEKVNLACLMWRQNATLRAKALGKFGSLAKEISRDPAMMRYLDLVRSGRAKPNENFARELLELFLLGEGSGYSERDVQEAARAFTGYRIDPRTLTFRFAPRQFDSSEKEFLGRRGAFDGDDVIDMVLQKPQCSEFLARKLWTFFAGPDPSAAVVQNLGAALRRSEYDLRLVLAEIFLSDRFYAPAVVRSQIKSPVQWIVQTACVLEAPLPAPPELEASCAQLGQVLFAPPNVRGWEGGLSWITAATLLFRFNLAGYIVSGKAPSLEGFDRSGPPIALRLDRIAPAGLRSNATALCDTICLRLLSEPVPASEQDRLVGFLKSRGHKITDTTIRDFLHLVMSTPQYQLT